MSYTAVLENQTEQRKGLTTTHQGGEAYEIDAWRQLRRFLILGTEGGTFYVNERDLTAKNIEAVERCLNLNPIRTINEIVDVSLEGSAAKQNPAILALAMAASYTNTVDPLAGAMVRQYALAQLPKVARYGTTKFMFAEYANALRGWGSALRRGVAALYTGDPLALAKDVTKYPSRVISEGGQAWSHRDLLRLSHPTPPTEEHDAIFKYVTKGEIVVSDAPSVVYLSAVESIKHLDNVNVVISLIHEFNLPREVIPTHLLNEPKVWSALLTAGNGMPLTAMLRNLGNLGKHGILNPFSDEAQFVVARLGDENAMRRARIHPLDILKAKIVYGSGRSVRGDGEWTPNPTIIDALEKAFYASFGFIEPSNKNVLLALDVSGSMTAGNVGGVVGLKPRIASAVMAMVTARTEPNYHLFAFSQGFVPIDITASDSLDTVLEKIANMPFQGTDCSLPMRYAQQHRLPVDAFVVYTDSETGGLNPSRALREYRGRSGQHDAKLIVVGMVANNFSIADPTDPNMLDVVGFDTAAPAVISNFIAGRV